jgi:hypothetical protein
VPGEQAVRALAGKADFGLGNGGLGSGLIQCQL